MPTPSTSSEVVESRPIEPGGPQGSTDFLESNIELDIGEEKTFRLGNMNRLAIGDPAVVDDRVIGDLLVLNGVRVGITTLSVWTDDGTRHSATVRVKAPAGRDRRGESYAPDRTVEVAKGGSVVFEVRGALERMAIGDPSIANVQTLTGNKVRVVGVDRGTTTLLVWTESGARISSLSSCAEALPGALIAQCPEVRSERPSPTV